MRESVARLREWLDAIIPITGQMAEDEDTQEAIDLWLDQKWLRDRLALIEEQEPQLEGMTAHNVEYEGRLGVWLSPEAWASCLKAFASPPPHGRLLDAS